MADRAAELHGGWLWTRGGGASPRGETWRRRWFTLVKDGRRAVLEFRAAQSSPKPLARLALTPSSECIRLVGADARRAANGRNCPAGVVLRFSVGGVTRLARASSDSAAEGWIAAVAQAAAAVVASPSTTRRASDVDGELARLSARRREMERVDAALRANMRLEISRLHDQLGITTVYVTHDQTEAMTLADRIVVLNEGVIMQAGSPRELYSNPQNKFVAEFIGSPKMNLMRCREEDGQLSLLSAGIQNTGIPATGKDVAWLGVRPEHITLCDPKQGMLAGTIMVTEYLGSEQYVYVDCGFEDVITVRIDPAEDFEVGSNVGLMLARESLHLFDEGESRLKPEAPGLMP